MPVEQPVLDTNYKHLKIIRTWPKTTMIKSITIAERETISRITCMTSDAR